MAHDHGDQGDPLAFLRSLEQQHTDEFHRADDLDDPLRVARMLVNGRLLALDHPALAGAGPELSEALHELRETLQRAEQMVGPALEHVISTLQAETERLRRAARAHGLDPDPPT